MLLAAVALASIMVGTRFIGPLTVVGTWLHPDGSDAQRIVEFLRVPRTVAGLLAGAALGLSGALLQGLTRNPLAGPEVLGVNAGAALAIVVGIAGFGASSIGGHVGFAFVGATLAGVTVYVLASRGRGGASPVKLALAGAAATALLGGFTTALTLLDLTTFNAYRFWSVGALTSADAETLAGALPFLSAGTVLAIGSASTLNALALGPDMARTLGVRVTVGPLAAAVATVLLTGTAVAIAGPIAFVGLTVPHLARAIAGSDYRRLLPWSAVLAPIVLLAADIVGRLLARPEELQAGLVTAFVGAPVFIALVRRPRVPQL